MDSLRNTNGLGTIGQMGAIGLHHLIILQIPTREGLSDIKYHAKATMQSSLPSMAQQNDIICRTNMYNNELLQEK